jgi:hypothetical protein
MQELNIFYEEPENDRWVLYDRYPRRIVRTAVRKLSGKKEPVGGVKKWFINLVKGLDVLGIPYKINDFKALRKTPNAIALVIGKSQVIDKIPDHVKIIYGPAIASHPSDNSFWGKKNIAHLIISCEWLQRMYQRDIPVKMPSSVWPSGIETDDWLPNPQKGATISILVYDKIRWQRDTYEPELLNPIIRSLERRGLSVEYIRYGAYKEDDFKRILGTVSGMVFLCEHETQGFAYLQTLSCDVPILAWDRGGAWQDPAYYPSQVKFGPVTSVPYWEDCCGEKFTDLHEYLVKLEVFLNNINNAQYTPRDYILKNFRLEHRALEYLSILERVTY